MKSQNKKCPHIGGDGYSKAGARLNYEADVTSVDRKEVDLCLYCPFWDEKTLVGECVFDEKGADCFHNSDRQNKNLVAD